MARAKSSKEGNSGDTQGVSVSGTERQNQKFDPSLVSLFAQSLGAVKVGVRPVPRLESHSTTPSAAEAGKSSSAADSEENGLSSQTFVKQVHTNSSNLREWKAPFLSNGTVKGSSRKRKRKDEKDDLESRYMSQLAKEEIQEDQNRASVLHSKRQNIDTRRTPNSDKDSPNEGGRPTSDCGSATGSREEFAVGGVPQHESFIKAREDLDLEKSSRTVFLANVSTMAIKSQKAKKILVTHLASCTSSLPVSGGHSIESLRFRSTAFAASGIPKKASFVKKEIMDSTTKSTNAYAVYTTQLAAREAAKGLNGSIVLDRHLRVDSVAHPAKIDHRRCVFVGNLGFVDDEANMNAADDDQINRRQRKAKEPADVEEGLWRQFEKAGVVESVRVVRDKTTRVGKGFAYIQFKDANSVEKALLYHEKKFPPMLPRILRVTRAKDMKNAASHKERQSFRRGAELNKYSSRIPAQIKSSTGRAHKLLGRSGAAKLRAMEGRTMSSSNSVGVNSPESIVFEGFRASRRRGRGSLRIAGRKHSKPSNRSKEFKAKGRKTKP